MTSTTDTTKEECKPKFTYNECRTLMDILKITHEDLNTLVIIENFTGYGVYINGYDYGKATPKITRAASKTGYYTTTEDYSDLSTAVVEDKIIKELRESMKTYLDIVLSKLSLE